VRKGFHFHLHVLYCICSCARICISTSEKYYSLSAVKIWDHTKSGLKGNRCRRKPHIMWNYFHCQTKDNNKDKEHIFCVSRLWEAPSGRFIFVSP
jgi:hypothetical protein